MRKTVYYDKKNRNLYTLYLRLKNDTPILDIERSHIIVAGEDEENLFDIVLDPDVMDKDIVKYGNWGVQDRGNGILRVSFWRDMTFKELYSYFTSKINVAFSLEDKGILVIDTANPNLFSMVRLCENQDMPVEVKRFVNSFGIMKDEAIVEKFLELPIVTPEEVWKEIGVEPF